MRANHVNPLGRSKPLPVVASQVPDLAPSSHNFDFTADDQAEIYLFDIKGWVDDSVAEYSYEYVIYDDLFALLWESPTARWLINFAAAKNWRICVEPLEDAAYDLDEEWRVLTLNNYNLKLPTFEKSGYFRHTMVLALIKGLRDIWHIESHQPYEHGLSIESIVFLERVRAADCDVIALLCAWELRSESTPEIWRHIIGAPEGDMAMRFTKSLESDPGRLFDGSAPIEAFHQWFANKERVAACDHQTLDMVDYNLEQARENGLYAKKRPKPQFIEGLSRLPDKSHYLRGFGYTLQQEHHFVCMEDEVNQAYYLQLKREMEATTIGAVAFRDAELAARIFPAN